MIYLKLFELTVIVVIVVDISGFVDSIKTFVGKVLSINNVSLKPLDCSFCVNWWLSLGYLVITNELNLTTVMVTLLLSTMTPIVKDAIYLVRDLLGKIINKIYNI